MAKNNNFGGNLIWRMAKNDNFGGNIIWRMAKNINFGGKLIWRIFNESAKSAKISSLKVCHLKSCISNTSLYRSEEDF